MVKQGQKSRGWAFTINNYTEQMVPALAEKLSASTDYFVFGREVGARGTPHLQGYLYFNNPRGFATAKATIGIDAAHVEAAKKPAIANYRYCTKQDKEFIEHPSGLRPEKIQTLTLSEADVRRIVREEMLNAPMNPEIWNRFWAQPVNKWL